MKISPEAQYVIAASAIVAAREGEVKTSKGFATLARLVSKHLGRPVDRAAIQKVSKDDRKLKADEMRAIEAVSGKPAPTINAPMEVPLIDWVAAGSLGEPVSQIPVENAPMLALTDLGHGKFFALKVRGNSMDKVAPEDSVIVVNHADRELIHGKYYVFSNRGDTTFKLWHSRPPDPAFLQPYSSDPSHGPIFIKRKKDLQVVGRVVRSILDLR